MTSAFYKATDEKNDKAYDVTWQNLHQGEIPSVSPLHVWEQISQRERHSDVNFERQQRESAPVNSRLRNKTHYAECQRPRPGGPDGGTRGGLPAREGRVSEGAGLGA